MLSYFLDYSDPSAWRFTNKINPAGGFATKWYGNVSAVVEITMYCILPFSHINFDYPYNIWPHLYCAHFHLLKTNMFVYKPVELLLSENKSRLLCRVWSVKTENSLNMRLLIFNRFCRCNQCTSFDKNVGRITDMHFCFYHVYSNITLFRIYNIKDYFEILVNINLRDNMIHFAIGELLMHCPGRFFVIFV